jgi:hypothetical protein
MRYWIGVVSKEHVEYGVQGGIMQLGHGKRAPLARLKKDDWLIYYSPTVRFGGEQPLQAFTAIGQVADDEIYQYAMSEEFTPYRRRVSYRTEARTYQYDRSSTIWNLPGQSPHGVTYFGLA